MRRFTTAWLAFLALAAVVQGGPGCRQIVGVEDRDPPRACLAPGTGPDECQDCLAGACCNELEACGGDPACHGEGKLSDVAVALRVCRAASCADPCELECGGAGVPVVGCQPCGRACCAQAEACEGSMACGLFELCREGCSAGDAGCREACVNSHPEGASLARMVDECVAASCDLASDWSCLGSIEWKPPAESEYSVKIVLLDNASNQPVPGIDVKGCRGGDPACLTPFAEGVTGPNGFVRFDVPATDPGSFIEYGGGDYYNHRAHLFPPLAHDLDVWLTVVRTAEFEAINRDADWTLDEGRGVLLITALDCKGRPATGATFSADTADERTIFAQPPADVAEGSFGAIIFNLPAGTTTITATVSSLCQSTGSIVLPVKADTLGITVLPPTP